MAPARLRWGPLAPGCWFTSRSEASPAPEEYRILNSRRLNTMVPKCPSVFHASKWLVKNTGGLSPTGDSDSETFKPTPKIYLLKIHLPDAWDINQSLRTVVLGFDSFSKESNPPSLLWVLLHTDLGLVSDMRRKTSWESQIRPPRVLQATPRLKSGGDDHLCYNSPNLIGCDMPFWTHHFCDLLLSDPGDIEDLRPTPCHPGNTAATGRWPELFLLDPDPQVLSSFTHSSLPDPAVPA